MANSDGPMEYLERDGGPEPDDPWLMSVLEAVVLIKAIDTGGIITVTPYKMQNAMEKAKRWYPNGPHAHYEQSHDGYKIELVDAATCERSNRHPDNEGFEKQREWGGSSQWVDPDRFSEDKMVAIDPESGEMLGDNLTEKDLSQVNHAQHVLLSVALARLGTDTIEVTKEEYQRATGLDTHPMGALIISRKGDKFFAAMIKDSKTRKAQA